MELHERVRYLRKNVLQLSQTDFAAALGTSRDAINNIEGNRLKRPEQKEPLLKLMCEKFSVNEKWLLTGEGEILKTVSRDEEIAVFMGDVMRGEDADFRRRLVSVLARLEPAEWELLEKMALKLAAESKKEDQAEA